MEHAVSDWLVDRIDSFLGHPVADPHGDPIPRADGSLESPANRSLAECATGEPFALARVMDQSPQFLRYLAESGMLLGAQGEVLVNRAEAGVVTVRIAGQETTLGHEAAKKILVSAGGKKSPRDAATSIGE
jgi:DtxR family Mn-dependent transcriptional regulator